MTWNASTLLDDSGELVWYRADRPCLECGAPIGDRRKHDCYFLERLEVTGKLQALTDEDLS